MATSTLSFPAYVDRRATAVGATCREPHVSIRRVAQWKAPASRRRCHESSMLRVTSGTVCKASSTPVADTEWEDLPLPEGDLGLPIVGQTFEWLRHYFDFYKTRFNKHGKIWKMRVLGRTVVVIADNESVRRLLAKEHKLVESYWPGSMRALLGESSILQAPAHKHQPARKLLNQAFTPAAIASYTPAVSSVVSGALEEWAGAGSCKAWEGCRRLAFDVAAMVLLGRQMDAQTVRELRDDFEIYTAGLFAVPLNLPFTAFGKAMAARGRLLDKIGEYIEEARQKEEGQKGTGRRTALQLLLSATDEQGHKLTDPELKDQILTQLFAGHETTGATMMHTLGFLEANPQWLAKLRQEQRDIVAEYGTEITAEVMEKMPCVDATIKEALRVRHPVTGGVWRRSLEPLVVAGYRIPKGWTLELALQKSWEGAADLGPDQDRFDPSRWLSAKASREEPKSFIPWGAGPRTCLGMGLAISEMRVMFALLARSYEFKQADPDEIWVGGFFPSKGLPFSFCKLEEGSQPAPSGEADSVLSG